MKVTYYEVTPLNGDGTLTYPATRWKRSLRSELCNGIRKMGNLWYMMRGGYVYMPIDVHRIAEIDGYAVCDVPNTERFVVSKDGASEICYGFEDVLNHIAR